jgi:hypothetical protein
MIAISPEEFLEEYSRTCRPVWRAGVQYRAWTEKDDQISVQLLLANSISTDEERAFPRHFDPHMFAPELCLIAPRGFLSGYMLRMLPARDYRINPYTMAIGVNCDINSYVEGDSVTVSTDILPIYLQMRNKPGRIEGYPHGGPTFLDLADDPLPHLEAVLRGLQSYARDWTSKFDGFVQSNILRLEQKDDYELANGEFLEEIERFREGVEAISDPENSDLLTAFRLMNEAFGLLSQAKPSIQGWYPYQLVFIVSNLPDLLARTQESNTSELNPVVLWYPTGGGKTEAYFGLAIANAFWDRLRAKSFGITAWCKFPLRLLSMQQLGRICALMAYAESVRLATNKIPDNLRGDPFSVGLYAGSKNSANFLDFPSEASKDTTPSFEATGWSGSQDPLDPFIKRNRKMDKCPMCTLEDGGSGTIVTTFNPTIPAFQHICDQCGSRLHLHVSDTETFRWLPTIVVGTIDKLASLGRVPATKIFFGYARRKCDRHGYLLYDSDRCPVLSCGGQLENVQETVDPAPSLLIQDELHFLRETLGAFDSHYETMTLGIMREACRELDSRICGEWKIVGSTATIEGYQRQIRHLYGKRNAIRFPVPGPVKGEHFYSNDDPDEIQRLVLGFRPQNMSHVDAVMKVLLSFHRLTLPLANGDDEAWQSLGEPFMSMSEEKREELMDRYRTSLTYALTRAECGGINKSFVRQLNPQMAKDGLPEFEQARVRNLTGEMGSDDVQKALNDLEHPPEDWIQAITATSMVSHGVDLEALNLIIFRGQPHTISEWIQAMSRVGRATGFPSIVVNVYNPNRERDATYYHHHKKYIEHAGALIRVVPITRFSPSALRKTAPGLFYNAVSYFASPQNVYYMYTGQLNRIFVSIKESVKDLMRMYIDIPQGGLEPKEQRLWQEMENLIETYQDILESPTSPKKTLEALHVMTNLREVDVAARIVPAYDYGRFSHRSEQQ